ncbi:MFS domain-containing protein [Psidium guajava]|nr:MFS domain-containing protein [Psidium guajava]
MESRWEAETIGDGSSLGVLIEFVEGKEGKEDRNGKGRERQKGPWQGGRVASLLIDEG